MIYEEKVLTPITNKESETPEEKPETEEEETEEEKPETEEKETEEVE